MSIWALLIESRVHSLKKRYPNLSDDEVDKILQMDPTDTKKFILWIAREYNPQLSVPIVKQTLIDWIKHIDRLTYDMLADFKIHHGFSSGTYPTPNNYKDIYTYTLIDVMNLVNYLQKLPTRREIKDIIRSETNKIYEGKLDGYDVLIVQPLSYRSSCYYGATTRWCTAAKTSSRDYNVYTNRGELFYVIFKDRDYENKEDGKPTFKYAIYLESNKKPQVFNETDNSIPPAIFFEKFPGIRSVFKFKLPLSPYEILKYLAEKKYNNDEQLENLLHRLDDSLNDGKVWVNLDISQLKNGKIQLFLDEGFVADTFTDEDSGSVVYDVLTRNWSQERVYSRDPSQNQEDWNNGYIFAHFDDKTWQKLLHYFEYTDPKGFNVVTKIINNQDWNVRKKWFDKLVEIMDAPIHTALRDVLMDEYGYAMENAINESGDVAVENELIYQMKRFFGEICQSPFELRGTSSVIVSLNDVLRWYQNGEDTPLPDDSKATTKSIASHLTKLNKNFGFRLYDAYGFYFDGDYDQDTFESEFQPIEYIKNRIDELEDDPEIVEKMNLMDGEIEKLERVNIWLGTTYRTLDNKYDITINGIDINSQTFHVMVKEHATNKRTTANLSTERIINLLRVPTMFDIMDEIYALFGQIIK